MQAARLCLNMNCSPLTSTVENASQLRLFRHFQAKSLISVPTLLSVMALVVHVYFRTGEDDVPCSALIKPDRIFFYLLLFVGRLSSAAALQVLLSCIPSPVAAHFLQQLQIVSWPVRTICSPSPKSLNASNMTRMTRQMKLQ